MKTIKFLLAILFSIAVAACGGGGGGGGGSNVTAPGAPTTVTASPGNTLATVSFTAPANNGGAAITGYAVTSSPGNITATGTTSPISVTGLTNGTPYTFTVVATNSVGNSPASTASNSVTPSLTAIVPSAPTAVIATAGNASATVTFTASASNGGAAITGYTVTSSPAAGTDSNAGATGLTHTITGLTNGTAYTFTVVATNSVGNSPASTASNSVTPTLVTTVPGAPTIGTATAGNTTATVTFTAPASTGGTAITGYTVTSSPAGGTDSNAGTTGLTHTITGLSNGTAYTFTVVATNSVGNSPASSASNSVTPVTVPGAPTSVLATAGNGQATVSFTAPASTGGTAITGYTVTSSPAGGTDSNAGTTGLTHTITGLSNGTAYTFTVVAANSVGNSPASSVSNSVTPVTGFTVPGVPTAVIATAGNASATVSFTAPASTGGTAITGYTVTSIPAGGTDSNAGTTVLTHTITGLSNGTAYTFTVKATNSVGNSPASSASNSVTPALTPVSGTVTGTWPPGVTITVSGGTNSTQTTNAIGNYSFNLASGSYTLTPSLPGYTFSPTNIPVTVPAGSSTAITGNDFVSSPAVASNSISGTVSYAGTQAAGPVSLLVYNTGNTCGGGGCSANGGTRITLTSGSGAYTIRGLQPGSYNVVATMDSLHTGLANASDPAGTATTTIVSSDVTASIALADPTVTTPSAPSINGVSPGNNSAFISYNPPTDANGNETATTYTVSWGATNTATGGGTATFNAQGTNTNVYFLKGLTNASTYFKLTANNTAGISTPSLVVGPVLIGTPTGLNTVSGTVTFTGTAAGPMLVIVHPPHGNGSFYYTVVGSQASPPVSGASYSITGVSSGSYGLAVIVDNNNNGVIDTGDFIYGVNGNASAFTVSGSTTENITLPTTSASAIVQTNYYNCGVSCSGYNVNLGVADGTLHAVNVTLISGPNVAVPFDMGIDPNNSSMSVNLNGATPAVGDSYGFLVTFSDLSTQIITGSVSAVLTSSNLAQSLAVSTASGADTPTFSWTAPGTAPAFLPFTYSLQNLGTNGITVASTVLSVNLATAGVTLTTGSYNWQVQVQDAKGNSASVQAPAAYNAP